MAILFFFSCNCISHSGNNQRKEFVSNTILFPEKDSVVESVSQKDVHLSEIDSIRLIYESPYDGFDYLFKYSNGELKIARTWEGRTISNIPLNRDSSIEMIVDRFIDGIDSFFISKSDSIEFKKVRRDYQICSDYPVLSYEIYLENKSVIKQTLQIGYEEYDVEYNPKFLEFYEFLDNLLRTTEGINEGLPRVILKQE